MEKAYVAVVQCHLVKQRCPGYFCEKAFHERTGAFARYAPESPLRALYFTCGGCCGRPLHRKLALLLRNLEKREGIGRDRVVVHFSSCIAYDNHHGPPCPHLDYLKALVAKLGVDVVEGTRESSRSRRLREEGVYGTGPGRNE